jgi:hypothetical protein
MIRYLDDAGEEGIWTSAIDFFGMTTEKTTATADLCGMTNKKAKVTARAKTKYRGSSLRSE